MTNRRLQREYRQYNKKYFNNKLPNITIRFGKLSNRYLGETTFAYANGPADAIIINSRLRSDFGEKTALLTLLHEMMHVKLKQKVGCHSKKWFREIRKLGCRGAFDTLI